MNASMLKISELSILFSYLYYKWEKLKSAQYDPCI